MKKFVNFLKTTAFSVLSFLMVFSIALNVKDTGNALRVKAVSTSKEYTTDFYTISYGDNEVKLLVNPDVRVYKNFSKEDLFTLKDHVLSVAYEAIFDDVVVDSGSTKKLNARRNANNVTSLAGKDVDISNITGVIDGQLLDLEDVDVALSDEGTYDTLIKYYVDKYIDAYVEANPTADAHDVLTEITTQLTDAIQTTVDNVNDGTYDYTTDIQNKVNSLMAEVSENIDNDTDFAISLNDVTDIVKTINDSATISDIINEINVASEIKDIVVNSDSQETIDFFTSVDSSLIVDVFKTVDIKKEDVKEMVNSVGADGVLDIIDAIGIDSVKEIANSVNLSKDDLTEVIKNNVSDLSIMSLFKVVKTISVDNHVIFADSEIKLSGLESIVRGLPKPSEIANYTDDQMHLSWDVAADTSFGTVEFNLTVGFLNGDCSAIRAAASTIAKTLDVSIDNGVVNVTLNTPANIDNIALRLINSASVSDDLKHKIFDNMSASVDEVYTKVVNKTYDEYLQILKDIDYKLIAANLYNAENLNSLFSTNKFTSARLDKLVDDVARLVAKAARLSQHYDYEDVKNFVSRYVDVSKYDDSKLEALVNKAINVLQKIDAKSFDSALVREFIDPNSQYTNANIDKYIDKLGNYEKYFNKALEYVERAYNAAPDRIKDNTLMDYYLGNGAFEYNGNLSFDLENILSRVSSKYGEKAYDVLATLFDKIPSNLKVSVKTSLTDIYQITYNYGDTTKVGLLPVGADVEFFANVTECDGRAIVGWYDADGNTYTKMPNKDLVLTAKLEEIDGFEVAISEGIVKTYDKEAYTLSVTTTAEKEYTYSYQWYKDDQALEGAVSDTLDLVNVADSGSYYCVVRVDSIDLEKTTDTVVVTIVPAEVSVGDVTWLDADGFTYTAPFTYDGTTKSVSLDTTTLPETIELAGYNGECTATNAGTYTATATVVLKDAANYTLVGSDEVSLNWAIAKATVEVGTIVWVDGNGVEYTSPFTYNNEAKTLKLDETLLSSNVVVAYSGECTATNAGTYTATATLSLVDAANYELAADAVTEYSQTWTIAKATVTVVDGVAWVDAGSDTYTGSFVYDGNEHGVEAKLNPALTDLVDVANSGEYTATNAGTYTATATIALKDAANYEFADDVVTEYSQTWTIAKATVTVSGVTWVDENGNAYSNPFTYDKAEHKVVATVDSSLENVVSVSLSGDHTATNAGTYTATATVALKDTANYELAAGTATEYTQTWTINKAQFTFKWLLDGEELDDSDRTVQYSGAEHELTISLVGTTLSEVTVEYTGNKATAVGTYTAIVSISFDEENYEVVDNPEFTVAWEIVKATVTVSGVTWVDENGNAYTKAFTYDGKEHKVVAKVDTTLESLVSVNPSGDYKATAVGTYTATATLTLNDADNYEFAAGTVTEYTQNWEIKKADEPIVEPQNTFEYKEGGRTVVVVTAKNGLTDVTMKVEAVNVSVDVSSLFEGYEGKTVKAYNITFYGANGDVANVSDEFTVKIYLPEECRGQENVKVVYIINDNGDYKASEDMNGTVDGDYMVFNTTHFSIYGIAPITKKVTPDNPDDPTPNDDKPNLWWLWLLIALLVVAVIVLVIVLVGKKKAAVVVVAPVAEVSEEVKYLQVDRTTNEITEVDLAEYEVTDILSVSDTNEKAAIGKVVRASDKVAISIFKDYHPIKHTTGKVAEDQVSVYKDPKDVVLEPEQDSSENQ